MMETKKLVVVYDALFQSRKTRQKVSKKAGLFFTNNLETIPDHTYLSYCRESGQTKKIYKMIKSKGTVREFNRLNKNKAIWIQKRAGSYGRVLT